MVLLIFADMRSCLVKEGVLAEAQGSHTWGLPRLVQMHVALTPSTVQRPWGQTPAVSCSKPGETCPQTHNSSHAKQRDLAQGQISWREKPHLELVGRSQGPLCTTGAHQESTCGCSWLQIPHKVGCWGRKGPALISCAPLHKCLGLAALFSLMDPLNVLSQGNLGSPSSCWTENRRPAGQCLSRATHVWYILAACFLMCPYCC